LPHHKEAAGAVHRQPDLRDFEVKSEQIFFATAYLQFRVPSQPNGDTHRPFRQALPCESMI
jgi:hypothetical protein